MDNNESRVFPSYLGEENFIARFKSKLKIPSCYFNSSFKYTLKFHTAVNAKTFRFIIIFLWIRNSASNETR